jgi:hypothetical protein
VGSGEASVVAGGGDSSGPGAHDAANSDAQSTARVVARLILPIRSFSPLFSSLVMLRPLTSDIEVIRRQKAGGWHGKVG